MINSGRVAPTAGRVCPRTAHPITESAVNRAAHGASPKRNHEARTGTATHALRLTNHIASRERHRERRTANDRHERRTPSAERRTPNPDVLAELGNPRASQCGRIRVLLSTLATG
jgi:hypothetical protein